MCLSTVYRNDREDDNILMKNVQTIECRNGDVILTDLFGRQLSIHGELLKASLTDAYALVKESA